MSEEAALPPEMSRTLDVRQAEGKYTEVVASAAECAALAARFALVRIDRLEAKLTCTRTGMGVEARGDLTAAIVQSCAVSGDDLPVTIAEPLYFRFVQVENHAPAEEVELAAEDCDEIEFVGSEIDLGEAVAQSLALAIDPFAEGPGADEARRRAGIINAGAAGPFAALAALKVR